MKRIINFGYKTIEEQLDFLISYLEAGEMLLFQYYDCAGEVIYDIDVRNEYFENYCDDVIYYYNPQLKLEINQLILDMLKNYIYASKKVGITAKELFLQMKEGDCSKISKDVLENIKDMIYIKLQKYNINNQLYNFVIERKYGISNWALNEQGMIDVNGKIIWYKPFTREECLDIIRQNQLFSCICLKEGENLERFSTGFVVEETAVNYDLLVF